MKRLCNIFAGRYVWAITLAVILSISSTYTLIDAFVLPKSYVVVDDGQGNSTNSTETPTDIGEQSEAQVSDMSYVDDNISINIEKISENGVVYYVAEVQLADISYFKTAFANNTFGKNVTQLTSEIAKENQAIFAINGDYYGFRDTGLIIRNGELYRDEGRSAPDNQALTVNQDGEMGVVTEGEVSGQALVDSGIWQSFSFGPVLVQDDAIVQTETKVSSRSNPRTAIGQIDALHYIFVVADGRSDESAGMTLSELAQVFVDRGAVTAYNLDGGGSSTMWFNGEVINNPTDGRHSGERSVSDIIYIGI